MYNGSSEQENLRDGVDSLVKTDELRLEGVQGSVDHVHCKTRRRSDTQVKVLQGP